MSLRRSRFILDQELHKLRQLSLFFFAIGKGLHGPLYKRLALYLT
jgi:hypothetical protein